MDVHAPIPVAVVHDDHDGLEAHGVVAGDPGIEPVEWTAETDLRREPTSDRDHGALVRRPDLVPAEGRGVQAGVDPQSVDDQEAAVARSEEVGHAAPIQGPAVTREL